MDSLELFEHEEEMYGGVVYNVSETKDWKFEPGENQTRLHHIEIPAGMTVKKARLYVYWYDYFYNTPPGCMANLSVNFSGTTFTTPDAAYTDQKGFGKYNTPKGTYAYDVTPLVTGSGDYTVIVENIDPSNNTAILGEMLFVVYEDPTKTTKIQLWILEGNDLLMAADDTHGSYNYDVSPEEATATVTFPGTIDVAKVSSATLISVVAQGNEPGANMLFNGEVIKSDAWDSPTEAYPNSKINVESVDVTANLSASGNNMGFQDTGTKGMQASNAFLVVTYKVVAPVVNITDFWIDNPTEDRGQEFIARVNLTTTAKATAGWYVVVVSGTGPESEGIAGVGTVYLTPDGSVDNVPVLVHIPALAKTGTYNLIPSVHTLAEYPGGLITYYEESRTATVK